MEAEQARLVSELTQQLALRPSFDFRPTFREGGLTRAVFVHPTGSVLPPAQPTTAISVFNIYLNERVSFRTSERFLPLITSDVVVVDDGWAVLYLF